MGGAVQRWTRTALVPALFGLVALAVLFGGTFYRFCIPVGRTMEACCCDHLADDADATQGEAPLAPPLARGVCCERRQLDALPIAAAGHQEAAPPPHAFIDLPVVASLEALRAPVALVAIRTAHTVRAPPLARPPPLQRKLALIQVYRC